MRPRVAVVSALALALTVGSGPAHAAPTENVHDMTWFVHIDMIDVGMGMDLAFYTQLITDHLAEADILLQGEQGPVDEGCCVVLDPFSVSTFGTTGDGLDMITTQLELDAVFASPGAYLVEMVHFCGGDFSTTIRGCAQTPGNALVVSFEADASDFLPTVMAHERGHNGGLGHVTNNACELMSASNGGGCLSVSECSAFLADADSTGGTCECLPDAIGAEPAPIGTSCADPSNCGLCSGGVCGACSGLAGTVLVAAGGVGSANGATTDDALLQAGLSSDWSVAGAIPVEVAGLAYDSAGGVLYGIEVLAGDDSLITLDPDTGAKLSTVGTLTGKAQVIALAFDPQPSGDRLFAIELDDDFFGTPCSSFPLTPPCFSELFEIDPSDASITVLGELNTLIITNGMQGLAWDDATSTLYAASPAGIATLTLSSCDGSTCPAVPFDDTFRSPVALAWDDATGLLLREGGDSSGGTEIDIILPSTGTLATRGVDPFTPGGLAARPVPEPSVWLGLVSGIGLLWGLARRRV